MQPLPSIPTNATLQTTLDVTNSLLEALSAQDAVRALAMRMSMVCHGTAVIYRDEGHVVARAGEAPTQLIWNEAAQSHRRDLEFEVGRWHVRTRRVAVQGGEHVLALASRTHELDLLGDVIFDVSERLFDAIQGLHSSAALRYRRDGEELLATLHDGVLPSREHRLWGQLGHFGFTAYAPVRVFEVALPDATSLRNHHVDALFAHARSVEVPLLIMQRRADLHSPTTAVGMVPASAESDGWVHHAASNMLFGVSEAFSELTRAVHHFHEAETAITIARQWASAPNGGLEPVFIDRIDLATWLLSHVEPRQLEERIHRTLAAIPQPQPRDTVLAFFANDQQIARTAEALFVHPNTVRYRLARAESALGAPLLAASSTANLILALYSEIRAQRGAAGRTGLVRPNPDSETASEHFGKPSGTSAKPHRLP